MVRFWRRSWWSLDRVVDTTFAVALAVLTVVNIFFPEPSMAYDYPPPNPLRAAELAWFTAGFCAGLLTREVRGARDRNHVRALEAEHTKAIATAEERVQERLRIARDMHDVVAHTLSVVSVQAGLARRLVPIRPDEAVEAIQRVEQSAREATNDLRRLLGVLREDQPDHLSPAPGIRELESLAKGHGAHVDRSSRCVLAGVGQRLLDDAEDCQVSVAENGGGATIAVANAASAAAEQGAGTSWGLNGLRERVEMYGGELRAGLTDSGGFELRVRL